MYIFWSPIHKCVYIVIVSGTISNLLFCSWAQQQWHHAPVSLCLIGPLYITLSVHFWHSVCHMNASISLINVLCTDELVSLYIWRLVCAVLKRIWVKMKLVMQKWKAAHPIAPQMLQGKVRMLICCLLTSLKCDEYGWVILCLATTCICLHHRHKSAPTRL